MAQGYGAVRAEWEDQLDAVFSLHGPDRVDLFLASLGVTVGAGGVGVEGCVVLCRWREHIHFAFQKLQDLLGVHGLEGHVRMLARTR